MRYDQYLYALVALVGTGGGLLLLRQVVHRSGWTESLRQGKGVEPQIIGVVGMLFALTLAFLANDTWMSRDRASAAVFQEADALHGIRALVLALPPEIRSPIEQEVDHYLHQAVEVEWPLLGQRQTDPTASAILDRLLAEAARPETARQLGTSVQGQLLSLIMQVRASRDQRLSLSQTHINPGKWFNMAGLGFLTLLVIAVVHIEKPRASITALILFALASAPMAGLVMIQSNPFLGLGAIAPDPLRVMLSP